MMHKLDAQTAAQVKRIVEMVELNPTPHPKPAIMSLERQIELARAEEGSVGAYGFAAQADEIWSRVMRDPQLARARKKLNAHELRLIIEHAISAQSSSREAAVNPIK
jgi:hypothetical protein